MLSARSREARRRPRSDLVPVDQTVERPVGASADTRSATVVDIHVGRRLRDRRLLKGLTQEQLASRLGVTFQQLQKYEKGVNRVSVSRLYHAAQILQVPILWFFEGLVGVERDDRRVAE